MIAVRDFILSRLLFHEKTAFIKKIRTGCERDGYGVKFTSWQGLVDDVRTFYYKKNGYSQTRGTDS